MSAGNLQWRADGWYTCGCGGTAKVKTDVPANTNMVVYPTPVAKFVTGISGKKYHVKPQLIMLDVDPTDAAAFIQNNGARMATPQDIQVMKGYFAQQ